MKMNGLVDRPVVALLLCAALFLASLPSFGDSEQEPGPLPQARVTKAPAPASACKGWVGSLLGPAVEVASFCQAALGECSAGGIERLATARKAKRALCKSYFGTDCAERSDRCGDETPRCQSGDGVFGAGRDRLISCTALAEGEDRTCPDLERRCICTFELKTRERLDCLCDGCGP